MVLTESGGGGTPTITLTAANTYYWSAAGNDTVDLAARLKASLDTASPTAKTYTVTPALAEGGAGTLVISVDSGTFTLTSVNTDLLALMGFTGDLSPTAASFTGTQHVEAAWLSDCPYNADFTVTAAGAGNTVAQTANSMAPDGTFYRFVGSTHVRNRIWWDMIDKGKVWLTGSPTLTAQTLEEFWDDVMNGAEPWAPNPGFQLRFYPDTGDDAVSALYNVVAGMEVPAVKVSDDFDGWHRVEIEVAQQ